MCLMFCHAATEQHARHSPSTFAWRKKGEMKKVAFWISPFSCNGVTRLELTFCPLPIDVIAAAAANGVEGESLIMEAIASWRNRNSNNPSISEKAEQDFPTLIVLSLLWIDSMT